jgi:putative FmdB family regulatory protein
MPIYTYRCTNCGFVFDQHQKYTDPALTKCPECEKKSLQKVFQPVGIVFKGSGFYATDHRSPSGQGRHTGSTKTGESSESSSSEKQAESIPASTAPATPSAEKASPPKED